MEKCHFVTGAQCMHMMLSLKAACVPGEDLIILSFPQGLKIEDRKRSLFVMNADSIHPMITTARSVMTEQINQRFLQEMPSETRLVQLFMSKQAVMSANFPAEWVASAKGFYFVWLRNAADALNISTHVSPPRPKKKSRTAYLFGGLGNEPGTPDNTAPAEEVGAGSDALMLEVSRWATLPSVKIEPFRIASSGMLDEFKLIFSLRNEFPLHFFVFRQTCVHIGHEANAEDTFSLSGSLSNENTHTGINFLSRLTRIRKNKKRFTPATYDVLNKYLDKFSKPKDGEDVQDMLDDSAESDLSASDEEEK